jgi:glycine betaine/proline transport system permease protein
MNLSRFQEDQRMAGKRDKPEDIITKLRQVEVLQGQGMPIADAVRVRNIDPQMIEAGVVSGCTRWQLLRRIKLPLALPEILLGLNQTIMLALSMLVITALVGTRDLGQEVYIALTKADSGRGIIAGLSIAFIAIIADRILSASARHARARLGLE